jgi:hypothetical protein
MRKMGNNAGRNSFGFEDSASLTGVQQGLVTVSGKDYTFPAPTKSTFAIFAPDYRIGTNGPVYSLPNGVYKFPSTYSSNAKAKTADRGPRRWRCL